MPPINSTVTAIRRGPDVFSAQLPGREYNPGASIERKWSALGGSPGSATSALEPLAEGHRIRYQHGAIYRSSDWTLAWVYGAIGERYDALGGPTSWLGFPLADEEPFVEGGRVSRFERGEIYWWPDVGAIELNHVVVHYTGLLCFGETDWDQGSDEDEPYVLLGVVGPTAGEATRTQVYGDVNSGDARPDLLELHRGKPLGLSITSVLMENDFGDPDKYKEAVAQGVQVASAGVVAGLSVIPVVGPFLALGAAPLLKAVGPDIVNEVNALLDTGDDRLGSETVFLSAKQMVLLATRTENETSNGVGFKVQTPLISGDGASYKACFGLVPG